MKRLISIVLVAFYSSGNCQDCTTTSYVLSGYSGTSGTLTAIDDGSLDFNWKIVQDPGGATVPYFPKVSLVPIPSWNKTGMQTAVGVPPLVSGLVKMISPESASNDEPGGVYIYETEFCLSGDATNIALQLKVLADNKADIYLNGNFIAGHDGVSGYVYGYGQQTLLTTSITNQSLFILNGYNVLQIRVTNYVTSSSKNPTPTGLCVFSKLTIDEGCTNFDCSEVAIGCNMCESLQPIQGEAYWISAWVKVANPNQVKTYYNGVLSPALTLSFPGSSSSFIFYPGEEIIDGWQRIVGKFEIPVGTGTMDLTLQADAVFPTYFDDIRIHPFNASMKSYVYDGETFWLVSELDDNNYATIYEYDEEGGLIRIKKETERGIVTIQETRSNTVKE